MKRINLLDWQGKSTAKRGDWGPKVEGLLDLDALKLPVPEACVFPLQFSGSEQNLARLFQVLVNLQKRLGWPMFSLRCGEKNNRGTLPETVLNLGLAEYVSRGKGAEHPSSYRNRLGQVCGDHVQAFFSFFGKTPPENFIWLPLLSQCQILVTTLGRFFDRAPGAENSTLGCGVVLQRMVLGTYDQRSLTGMCYTRNPYTGERMDYGHYLLNRQGMSLGGIHAPEQLDLATMQHHNPKAYASLKEACCLLETHYRDIRCLEYTAEGEDLYFLQNTVGNRTYRLQPADLQNLERELLASQGDEAQGRKESNSSGTKPGKQSGTRDEEWKEDV